MDKVLKCAKFMFLGALAVFVVACDSSTQAKDKVSNQDKAKEQTMQNETLKLVYPQWQGGDIAAFFKDLKPSEAAKGYILGAQILNLLVSNLNADLDKNTAVVPISVEYESDESGKRLTQDGIIDKFILQEQTKKAFELLRAKNPAKILTLGGECAVSVVPFSYLAEKYKDEVAMIWIDAHPDLGVAGDDFYKGYHAMAVSALVGDGELSKAFALPAHIKPQNVLFIGLNSNEAQHYNDRRESLGIQAIWGKDILANEAKAMSEIHAWLAKSGATKALIHLDLDVLDPQELYAAVGNTGILSVENVKNVINLISQNTQVVGLSVAEHLPKAQIKLKELLSNLPLIKE